MDGAVLHQLSDRWTIMSNNIVCHIGRSVEISASRS